MLRPFLFIGVGGSGGKTLRFVRHELERRLREIGWEGPFPSGWQFLHVDAPSVADGDDPDLPPQLPEGEYAGLVTAGVNYRNIDASLAGHERTLHGDWIAGWRPKAVDVSVTVEKGAGQFRALGRVITLANLSKAKSRLDHALNDISGGQVAAELQELTRLLGGTPSPNMRTPVALVVSSIAGGSGAGAVIDICDLLRASGDVWASDSIGILYSPDVFDHLLEEKRRGVRPNALATLAELLAGYWNRSGPSEETVNVLARQGVRVSDADRLGPRYSFLVGAKNQFVTYKTQNDIYHAMGRSLASWVTSTTLQDRMDAYVAGNWQAAAVQVPDALPVKTSEMETPFTALGSARVGLGRDRFRDYASERLARAAVERLLNRHEELRARDDQRASQAVAQEVADNAFGAFLARSGLNERTEQHNDILEAIRPTDREDILRALRERIFNLAIQGAPPKGRPIPEWRALISRRVHDVIDQQLDEFDIANRERGRAWVKQVQDDLRRHAAATVAFEGAPVTALLFRKLADELRAVKVELDQEASRLQRHGENVEQQVEEALRRAGGDILPAQHPQVSDAVKRGVAAIHFRGEARLRLLVSSVLPDLCDNVVLRLAEVIDAAGQALRGDYQPAQGQPSRISTWPDSDDVPRRLRPAANEFVLETAETFGPTLQSLINRSVEVGEPAGAFRSVVMQVIVGADEVSHDKQLLIQQQMAWTPREHELRQELSTQSPASYRLLMARDDLLGRAEAWVNKGGTPAGNYVTEGLNRFLDPDVVDPDQLDRRMRTFEGQVGAAVDAAQPLVAVKKSVLVAVHDRSDLRADLFFTEFPFSPASRAASVIRRVFESKGIWSAEVEAGFVESDRDYVDAFSVFNEPYHPSVFDSLMKPIAEEWGLRNKTADGREEFWRWRRARSLTEFIPTSPQVRRAMVRGWFIASLLGQVRLSRESATEIFVANETGAPGAWHPFPFPLLAAGIAAEYEYLPLILESMPLAFVAVSTEARITPVAPYRRLRTLGTSADGGLESYPSPTLELQDWIDKGATPLAAPVPNAEHAGAEDGESETRKETLLKRIGQYQSSYGRLFEEQVRRSEQRVPRAFELRDDILGSLADLDQAIRDHLPADGREVW